jgi:pentose-5-phosphate-3-epimerase
VDGGIKEELLYDIYKSGADVTVMGRSIFNSEKPREQLVRLKNLIANFK